MAKIRIYDLAKELSKESKDVLEFLGGADLKAASSIDEKDADKVRAHFSPKAEKKETAPVKESRTDTNNEIKKENTAEMPAEAKTSAAPQGGSEAEQPKKKKPVFLFHPENSSLHRNNGQQNRNGQGNRNGQSRGNDGYRQSQGGDRYQGQNRGNDRNQQNRNGNGQLNRGQDRNRANDGYRQNQGGRGVIRPNVPTTAQQYRDYAPQETPQTKAPVSAPVEENVNVTAPQNTAPEVTETPVIRETVPAVETAPVEKTAPAETPVRSEEAPKAEEVKAAQAKEEAAAQTKTEAQKAEEAPAKAAEAETAKTEATAKAEAPAKATAPAQNAEAAQKTAQPAVDSQKAETRRLLEKNTQGQVRNVYREMQEENARRAAAAAAAREQREREGGNQGQNRGERGERGERRPYNGDRPYNRNGQGGQGQNGERRPYNGDRPFNRNGQGGQGQNGERRPYNGDRPFNRNGQGGQGQNGDRPYNRNGQGGQGGQNRDNRGIFAGGNRQGGGSNVRFNRENSGEGQTSFSAKSDMRNGGRKSNNNNNQHEKARQDRDRTGNGKKAENFKNLSKGNDHGRKAAQHVEEEVIKMIVLPEVITLKDFADKMKMKPADLIKKLFLQGKMMTLNSELSYEEAEEIALEYEILCEKEVQVDVIEELLKEEEEDESLMVKRPPVVCVMGHVDHGKTSLLDAIRDTNVTAREAGGITQHIGAYMVECNGEPITFLDTPGHEAFTAMRMRGAQATDIAVLVVAADDGVKPQTIEAINHAKAAGVEIIVAVNKIDKPAADVERVKQEMMKYELVAEDWGGSTIFVPVSAKMHTNIDQLLEMILLVTEVKELKANPNREVRGIVIEAKLDKGRGPVATVLVQKGTMKTGDFVSCGSFYGRVRAMVDGNGAAVKTATPSMPVEILGLNGVPNAGEVCVGHKNEKDARGYADTFIAEEKKKMLAETKQKLTMDSLFAEIQAGNIKELPIIVKADVQGSVEAVKSSLEKLSNEEVSVKVIHGGVGAINESDVTLASASNAIVIGFNVKPDAQAKQIAEQEHVDLKLYRVIYQAIDDVEAAMKGMLAPVYEEKVIGHAEVRMTFKASGVGTIAGSYVLDGILERGCSCRVTRGKDLIFEGAMASLKRFKDDVKEVREGFECGVVLEKFNDLMEGDQIEAYKMVQVERE